MLYVLKKYARRLSGRKPLVPTRMACLGQDIYSAGLSRIGQLANVQKGRVDLMADWMQGGRRPDYDAIKGFVRRTDISGLIRQQGVTTWSREVMDSDWLIMDSFSELVDNKFSHKDAGWSFCASYADLNHTAEFRDTFSHEGLLPVDEIEAAYARFFALYFERKPGCKIIFMHFPDTFESREKYLERHAEIRRCLESFEQKYAGRLFNFTVPREEAMRPDLYRGVMEVRNPYHFAEETARAFLSRIDSRLADFPEFE